MKTEKEIKKRIAFLNQEKINWKRQGLIPQSRAFEKAIEELEWALEW